MDFYTLAATLTLAVQVTVLVLLVTAYAFKRAKKYRRHGLIMFSAVVVHLVLILSVMVPSINVIAFTQTGLSLPIVYLALIHATFGAAAAVLGVFIVGTWRLRTSLQYCQPKRKFMKATFILWVTAVSIGIILYVTLYFPTVLALL